MTIASTARKAGPLLGNGSATTFSFGFKVFATGDVKVAIANSAGVETVLTEGADYTVTLNANQETSPGGTVTYPVSGSPLPTGSVLSIIGDLDYDQPLDLPSGGNFSPLALENQLDRATMQIQQLKEQVDRSAKLPQTSQVDADSLSADLARLADSADNIDAVAGSIAAVNIVATNIADIDAVVANLADIQNASENAALVADAVAQAVDGEKQLFIAGTDYTKGVTAQLTLTYTPAKSGTVNVIFDGVEQHMTEWSLVDKTVTFTAAIPADKVEVHYFVPSQFVGLSSADLSVLGSAQAAAQASAASAQSSAAAAAGQAAVATSAKTAAEAARDAAQLSAGVYATTAAGLVATTTGKYFSVPSADSAEYLILYLNNAGVAVEQKRYPSAEVVKNLAATAVPGVEHAIQDSNDNASEYIEPGTGKRYVLEIDAETLNGIPRYRLNKATRSVPKLNASIVHHISYGQSLALGNGAGDVHTLPGGDDDGFFDSVMFNANGVTSAGPRAQEGSGTTAQNHASFTPYLEQPLTGAAPAGNVETPLGNAMRTVKRLLRDEDGIKSTDFDYILLGSAPGQSNTAIAGLAKGSTPYTNLINDVTYGLANAQTAGKSYCVDAVYWSQGERDIQLGTARLTYKNALLQLYTDLNSDIKAITGQTHDIKIVMYQCSIYNQFTSGYAGANIALAQLDAAKANSNIILATSVYAVEHLTATNVHLTAAGYANLGGYYGLAAKRAVVDGDQWANLYPTRLTRQGKILEIEFPDTGYPISASSTLFPSQANYGLTAVQTDGTTDNPIVSVTVTAPRRVRVVLTNALPGYLRYGFASWGGNLHDTCDIDPGTSRSLTLYRPVLTFDEAFQ